MEKTKSLRMLLITISQKTEKIFILLFNLIAMTILFSYLIRKFGELDIAKENLNIIIPYQHGFI